MEVKSACEGVWRLRVHVRVCVGEAVEVKSVHVRVCGGEACGG